METNIKKLREELGIEQQELAKRVGISTWWMNHIENGKRKPSMHVLSKIAEELGVSVKDLLI